MAETVPKRFIEYMRQLYGEVGAEEKLASVARNQQNRPEIVDGLPRMRMDRLEDPIPIHFKEDKPLWNKRPVQGVYHPGTRDAEVYSPSGRELPLISDQPSKNALPLGASSGAWMPWQSYVQLHESGHDIYRGGKKNGGSSPLKDALGVSGGVNELPVHLADVVRWGAVRKMPSSELGKNPEVQMRGMRGNMSTNPEEAAETWDNFGDFLKKQKTWGIWTKKKWNKMNKHRELIINYMPELAKTDQDEYATV